MDTRDINLFVFDTKDNFEKSIKNIGTAGSSFKKIICVEDKVEFDKEFHQLGEDEYAYMVVHVFYTDNINGIKRFVASTIKKRFPQLGFMYISEGDSKFIRKIMVEEDLDIAEIVKYWQIQTYLEEEKFKVFKKKDIIATSSGTVSNVKDSHQLVKKKEYPQCDYAIITALEEDEMQQLIPMITPEGTVLNDNHLIEFGFITNNPQKKVAYASQQTTGMIDAAILATELITLFNPKYLIMSGVLGGKPKDVKIGDVVVATKTFTIDKGKISQLGFKKETEQTANMNASITKLMRHKEEIIQHLRSLDTTRNSKIDVHFGPIACVRQVIDLEGYFEEHLSSVERKSIALEMESYAVSRACELVNNGQTKALIIKSAMDNTVDKVDGAKPYAAWSSANFIKYILVNDII